jgi:hypothetical protein
MFVILPITVALGLIIGCSDDNVTSPTNQTGTLRVLLTDASDNSSISEANVVLYNANNNESLMRKFTNGEGECTFEMDPGTYYVRITAQGYKEFPAENTIPIPFSITANQITNQPYTMVQAEVILLGKISGHIIPATNNVLVLATNDNSKGFSTVSGPDGFYVFFNLPFGDYRLTPYQAGFEGSSVNTTLNVDTPSVSIDLDISQSAGSVLHGSVTFLASENSIVDVSLLDPYTLSAIPGLSTMTEISQLYSIDLIPSGQFVAWASYQNDGYVMDPDWVRKNPGILDVSFTTGDTTELNFSVTGAITISYPTNPPDSVYPVVTDSSVVEFGWVKYPSTKEYVIEVKKSNGEVIWGGYNPDGSINHDQIPASSNSVEYDFDGTATEQLQNGVTYQWLLYSDKDEAVGVQNLISSSEIQMGLFKLPQ